MWYEYPIQAPIGDQTRVIKQLRGWILDLERQGIIHGFAFNHYSTPLPTLNVRFECTENNLPIIRTELTREVRRLLPNYVLQERLWDNGQSPESVYKAYEFGSRCAFLLWDLIDKGDFLRNLRERIYDGPLPLHSLLIRMFSIFCIILVMGL